MTPTRAENAPVAQPDITPVAWRITGPQGEKGFGVGPVTARFHDDSGITFEPLFTGNQMAAAVSAAVAELEAEIERLRSRSIGMDTPLRETDARAVGSRIARAIREG